MKLLKFDRSLNSRFVIGADEAGRGALAGPIVGGAVAIDIERLSRVQIMALNRFDDSKKLSHKQREELFMLLTDSKVGIEVASCAISAATIDRDGLQPANYSVLATPARLLVKTVVSGNRLESTFESNRLAESATQQRSGSSSLITTIVDGFDLQRAGYWGLSDGQVRKVIKGDATSAAIAAASIVAKVTRDKMMQRLDSEFPKYGFAEHFGYGTPSHLDALSRFGPSEAHRYSFSPVCRAHAKRQLQDGQAAPDSADDLVLQL